MSKKEGSESTSYSEKKLAEAAQQFDAFDKNIKEMTMDRMNEAPKEETEGPRVSQKEIDRSKEIWLKPKHSLPAVDAKTGQGQKFNEKFRKEYEFAKEYVQFIAENKECILDGEIELWTRPYGGMPAEFWVVPTNKPVWGPRYLAEQIQRKYYHRLRTDKERVAGSDGYGAYTGQIVADAKIQRLDARPVDTRRSIFMGASGF
jgi:hypothetical protein